METSRAQTVAGELLYVVMLVMRTVAADMRRSRRPIAPAQMGGLMRIAASPCTMSDLARYQAVSLPTISKSVDMLVRRGWVERRVDGHDRRHSMVRLTPRGRRVLADIRQKTEQLVTQRLAPLASEERTQLVEVLSVLRRVLTVPSDDDDRCAPRATRLRVH